MSEANLAERLKRLRADGWTVAVHNDYRFKGQHHTFWLFTCGDFAIKGEATTDDEALEIVEREAERISLRSEEVAQARKAEREACAKIARDRASHIAGLKAKTSERDDNSRWRYGAWWASEELEKLAYAIEKRARASLEKLEKHEVL